jgi:hypothetical protein
MLSSGFSIGYNYMFNNFGSHFEYGGGPELTFFEIKPHGKFSEISYNMINFPFIGRYYFREQLNVWFLSGIIKINGGSETIESNLKEEKNYFIGPTFEFGLGFQIGHYVDFMASVHQIYNWGSEILPNDFGLNFNAHISFGYK